MMIYPVGDTFIGGSLRLYGEYSEAEVAIFRQLIRAGDVVIEAGSHIGAHTLPLARFVGPQGRVIAFEPQVTLYRMLQANLVMNGVMNVDAHRMAVGARQGTVRVPEIGPGEHRNFGGLTLTEAEGEGLSTPVVALDGAGAFPAVKLLKADVEGMELASIQGARTLITRHRPFLYLESDRIEKHDALLAELESLHYAAYWHPAPYFQKDNYFGHREDVFGVYSGNLFCAPAEKSIAVNNLRPARRGEPFPFVPRRE
jgi:FkbM family methyltransferase